MWIIISNTLAFFIIVICKYYFIITIVDFFRTMILLAKARWVKPFNNGMWIITKLTFILFLISMTNINLANGLLLKQILCHEHKLK